MDAAWARRMRWRRRGAWMWPAFMVAVVVDGLVGHVLPLAGDGESLPSAALFGLFMDLLAVVLLSWPLAVLLRRRRRDLPMVVARDYAGTVLVCGVTVVLVLAGVAHRSSVSADRAAVREAVVRAEAYIGARAPAEFRRNVGRVNMFTIEQGSIYRACVPATGDSRTYCVVVNTTQPFATSVRFSGYEPNSIMSEGVW